MCGRVSRTILRAYFIWVCLKIVYPYTQWLMIIIPTKWLYIIGGIPHFQPYPYAVQSYGHSRLLDHPSNLICNYPKRLLRNAKILTKTCQSSADSSDFGIFWLDVGVRIPSGKRLHRYGKSPCFMGKSTINGPFSIANC